jgi:hypothetical protein
VALQLEILVLRHQLGVLHRSVKHLKLTAADRCSRLGYAVSGRTGAQSASPIFDRC